LLAVIVKNDNGNENNNLKHIKNMPLNTFSEHDLRHYCKRHIETLENWLRTLIDNRFTNEFGKDYFTFKEGEDNIIKKEIQKKALERKEKESDRYQRLIDATLFEDIVSIICNPQLYRRFFEECFKHSFPEGNDELRTFLNRLLDPRNKLAHSNPISVRQAEQVICYSNDIIDSIKLYYINNQMSKEYNIPTITKIVDSKGNIFFPKVENSISSIFSLQKDTKNTLFPGDIISVEIEIDSSFKNDEYELVWKKNHEIIKEFSNKTKISIEILKKDIAENFFIECVINSKEEWHKHTFYDQSVSLLYKILPSN
jgi:hypothetical protein